MHCQRSGWLPRETCLTPRDSHRGIQSQSVFHDWNFVGAVGRAVSPGGIGDVESEDDAVPGGAFGKHDDWLLVDLPSGDDAESGGPSAAMVRLGADFGRGGVHSAQFGDEEAGWIATNTKVTIESQKGI